MQELIKNKRRKRKWQTRAKDRTGARYILNGKT